MDGKPLVPFFEGRTRSFYKYPMSVSPYFILSEGFHQYEMDGRDDWVEYFERERNNWFEGMLRDFASRFHEMVADLFSDPSDDELLRAILSEHGIHNYRFFRRTALGRVARHFAVTGVSVEEVRYLVGELPRRYEVQRMPRGWHIETERSAVVAIFEHLYEQTVLRTITDPIGDPGLESWFKRFLQPRKCGLCGHLFRVIDTPSSYYFGSNACTDCCFGCRVTLSPGKDHLMSLLPAFVEVCGFVPNSSASPTDYDFTSRLSVETKIDVFRAYARMGGVEHVKNLFGSWFEALVETGTLPEGVLTTARGIRCLAEDGHVWHSLEEQYIDNWLSSHGIPHIREPYYPSHSELNPRGRRRADWQVGDTFIEYFGLVGDEQYEERMLQKMLLAEHSGVDLISLYPCDLHELDRCLGKFRRG